MADPVRAKIAKLQTEKVTPTELEVARYLNELENSTQCEIQGELGFIRIAGAVELNINGDENKKLILISFPYRIFCDHVRKIQGRLIGELEKKLRKHVIVYGKRRILSNKNFKKAGMKVLPRSRTLTAVQEAVLEDIVAPTEIAGKRIRVRVDGSKLHKVFLGGKDKNKNFEEKLDAFSEAFKHLTAKVAVFSFED